MTQDQIVNAITNFAVDQLAPKAVKDGMIPAEDNRSPLAKSNKKNVEARSRDQIAAVRQSGQVRCCPRDPGRRPA